MFGAIFSTNWIEKLLGRINPNVISMRFNADGTKAGYNVDFVESVVHNGAGDWTINFKAGFFTETPIIVPACDDIAANDGYIMWFRTLSTTSGVLRGRRIIGPGLVDMRFVLVAHMQGNDYLKVKN